MTTTTRTPAGKYRAGETFTCTKRTPLNIEWTEFSEPCGTEIRIHGYHWCAQVCPKCLANYFCSADNNLYQDNAGYYPADTAARVRANIAANGGQYIPEFK